MKYRVEMTRVEYHSAEIEVEADSEEEAERMAIEDDLAGDDWRCCNAYEEVDGVYPIAEDTPCA